MFVKYTGPESEVDVPEARLTVKRNQTIEVPDDIGVRMALQEDSWKEAAGTKSAPVADPVVEHSPEPTADPAKE